MERICFTDTESGEDFNGYILEQTSVAGVSYLFVTEEEEEDSDAYILKEVHTSEQELVYVFVDDEEELTAIAKIFSELLEDCEIRR